MARQPATGKAKGSSLRKRPAAQVAAAPDPATPAAAAPVPALAPALLPAPLPARDDYSVMHYSKHGQNSIGIRAKFGAKNQVMQFGSKKCTKTEAEMRAIAATVIADLHEGMSVANAKSKANLAAGI